MTSNVIELKNIAKAYVDHMVLQNFQLEIKHGEFLTLLGPSGCGKTTILRLIAGLEMPDCGQIYLNGTNITQMPANLRHVHTVFQSYALFPHMNVFENVAFGLRCQHCAEAEISARVTQALATVKLAHLARRKPDSLSGGQQQRVAIARAIVNRPLVLLLDESLGSLDYRLRKSMQLELKHLQRELNISFVFVTHDQEEALSMSDRIVVMHEGVIEQIGTPRQVYEEPCNLKVAEFIGEANIFDIDVLAQDKHSITVALEDISYVLKSKRPFTVGDKAHLLIRPEDLRVWGRKEIAAQTNLLAGVVEDVIYKGTTVDLMVRLKSNKLLAATEFFDEDDEDLEYNLGETVYVNWLPGWEVILPYER